MRAKTREVLSKYEDKFGKVWPADLSKLKNSAEAALILEVEEALKKPPQKKVKKWTSDISYTGKIVEEE